MTLLSHVALVTVLAAPEGAGADDIPPYPHELPAWYERLEAALAKPIDAFELGAPTPLAEAVEALAQKAGVAIVLADGAADGGTAHAPVRLRVAAMSLENVLRLLTLQTGRELAAVITPDEVVVTDRPEDHPEPAAAAVRRTIAAARAWSPPRPDPARARIAKALEVEVNLQFDGTPLADVVAALRQVTGVDIIFNRQARQEVAAADPVVDATVESVPARDFLDRVFAANGFDWVVKDGALLVMTRPEAERARKREEERLAAERRRGAAIEAIRARRVEAECRGWRPHEVVAILVKELPVPVHADPEAWATPARVESATAGKSLREVADALGGISIEVVVTGDAVFLRRGRK